MVAQNDARLLADTYRDDVQCQIRLEPSAKDEIGEVVEGWISERLLHRLRHLALAYELPLLGRLPGQGSMHYPEVQLAVLEEELAFLFGVVQDRALLDASVPLREMITKAQHKPRGWSIVVETP